MLRHQSFGRVTSAGGRIRTRVDCFRRAAPPSARPRQHSKIKRDRRDSNSRSLDRQSSAYASRPRPQKTATTRLELAKTELRTQALDSLHSSPHQYRLQDLNPGHSLIGQVCCQLHQAGIFRRTGSGRRPRTSTLRFQKPACCRLHHPGTRANDRTRTCIDESHNLVPDPFGHVRHKWQGWRDSNSLSQA